MEKRLIKLTDGTLIEVEVPEGEARLIAGKSPKKVESNLQAITSMLANSCRPIAEDFKKIAKDINASETVIEFGMGFSIGGNVFIVKSNLDANMLIRITFKSTS